MKKLNLLIVDDDDSVMQMYKLVMQKFKKNLMVERPDIELCLHYETCGEDAVEKAKLLHSQDEEIAGGFFDMKMPPGIDGFETIRRIEEFSQNLMYCVVTAYHDRSWEDFEELFGQDYEERFTYYEKPFKMKQIQAKTTEILEFAKKVSK